MIGATFSQAHYDLYKKTGNKNLFEEVLDKLVMDNHLDLDQDVKDYIMSEDIREDKRIFILSNLLKEKSLEIVNSFTKLRDCDTRTQHLNEALLTLNKYIEVGQQEVKKYGEVFTPLSLVKEMVATLPKEVWSNPNLKWLDPANGMGNFPLIVIYKLMNGLSSWEPNVEKRYKHIIENMIYVCELQPRNAFMYLSLVDPKDDLSVNLYCGSFLDEGFDKHMKQVWNIDNFNIVMGNPPYNRSIDLKFLNKSYSISDTVLFVHPSTWLIDERNQYTPYIKSKELVKNHLESIKLFNGNHLFDIGLFVPCVITYINKYKNSDIIYFTDEINNISGQYKNIDEINKYSNTNEYISIKKKIYQKENLYTHLLLKKEYNFYVNASPIRGHVNLRSDNHMLVNDFYTFVPRDKKVENFKKRTETNLSMLSSFGFNTENEAENFLNYIKTDFARFCLSVYKITQNQYSNIFEFVPWLDFNQEWTDKKLKEYFNITDKEWKFIKSVIPKYY